MKKLALGLFLTILNALALFGQSDTIYTVEGDQVICKVVNIGDEKIKYERPEISDELTFNISTSRVAKISLKNGKVIYPNGKSEKKVEKSFDQLPQPEDQLALTDQRKNAIKVNFSAPIFATLELMYERNTGYGNSFEFGIAFKGKNDISPIYTGVNLRAGYKFLKDPKNYLTQDKYAHILKGSYIKPEVIFSSLSGYVNQPDNNDGDVVNPNDNFRQSTAMVFMLSIGNQIVYNNNFVVDIFLGAGYGFTDEDMVDNDDKRMDYAMRGGLALMQGEPNIAVNAGVRIGFLF